MEKIILALVATITIFSSSASASLKYECSRYVNGNYKGWTAVVADNKKKPTKKSKKNLIRRLIMLSVNKVVAALFLFYLYGAYAVDVSTLDISGIKLGMKKDEVLKKMPCSNSQSDMWKLENGKKHLFIIDCGSPETALDNFFRVFLDRNGSAYSIMKKIVFNVIPDFPKIRKNLSIDMANQK